MKHKGKILIVDDETANVRLLERILEISGYLNFVSTSDPRQVLELFRSFQPDLVLTDLHMPHLDGFAVMQQIRACQDPDTYVPILVLTADVTVETRRRALGAGATDFLVKPFDHMEAVLRIGNMLQTRSLQVQLRQYNATLEEKVQERTRQLEEALNQLRTSQQQLVQQERFRALGTMAGGIAHDFNNALASILGYAELLLLTPDQPKERIAAHLKTIITAGSDAARMVARLREFSRPAKANAYHEAIQLNGLVGEAVSLSVPKWKNEALANGRTIVVQTEPGEIPAIQGDPSELREALINLIFNAVDAMPNGGSIVIRTRFENEYVHLELSDTGTGMSEEVRQRCLEPYFTTKGTRGTGLGLAMVYGIVHRHGGEIEVMSEPGKGTTFLIQLPAGKKQELGIKPDDRKVERPLNILVVDDQPLLRQLLSECLMNDRHIVETAPNGREGLLKFKAGRFDLVLTDKAMPEMDGDQMARAIRELRPEQPIILLTGYAESSRDGDEPETVNLVLGKPVSMGTLRKALAEVISE